MPPADRSDADLPLRNRRIGLLEARRSAELAALFERLGGSVLRAPCLREAPAGEEGELEAVLAGPVDLWVFQTGVGADALFDLAARFGREQALAGSVRGAAVLARGPKPLAVLLRRGYRIQLRTGEPHTTAEIIGVLEGQVVAGRRVAVQHHGGPNVELVDHLRRRGAEVLEVVTYRWQLPQDLGPVLDLLRELEAGRVDVVAFSSAAQVHNLFLIAERAGVADRLAGWLSELTVTAAIGPSCARALTDHGATAAVVPGRPKMVPLVDAVRDHLGVARP
ncbi:MAG TPA: uroporphyrinogen-III synthase [Candidatus Dormibacteraeota bacterium]|nr:uroporphyrinogen-III synthase [Candidatus Dormibacteraeota bacterium]